MMPYIRPGCASMSRNTGYSASISTSPSTKATPTSRGVCTPRYIREKPIRTTMAKHSALQPPFAHMPRQPKEEKAFCVCPLGKE